jgi:hypothetical protein
LRVWGVWAVRQFVRTPKNCNFQKLIMPPRDKIFLYTNLQLRSGPFQWYQMSWVSISILFVEWNGPGTTCSPAATLAISAVVLDRLPVNVIIDRLNASSSGSVVYMKMQKYVSSSNSNETCQYWCRFELWPL